MNRQEEYEFYAQPENQMPQGPGRRRKAAMTAMVPVRLPEDILSQIRDLAEREDRSVSSWIRRAVKHELERQETNSSTGDDLHVVPNRTGGWDIVGSGKRQVSQHTDSQATAIECARRLIRNFGGGELVIHGRDGQIRDSGRIRGAKDSNPTG